MTTLYEVHDGFLIYFLSNAKKHYADDTALFVSNAYLQGRTLNTITDFSSLKWETTVFTTHFYFII